MSQNHLNVTLQSRFFQSPAFPPGSGPDFVNAVAAVETDLSPSETVQVLHQIESEFGRTRRERWAPRVLDLDLLAQGDAVLPRKTVWQEWADLPLEEQKARTPPELILPHPRIQDRAFVLVPLMDIAPDWCHPVTGLSVREMVAGLDPADVAQLQPLDGADSP